MRPFALENFEPGFSPDIKRSVLVEILEVTLAPLTINCSFSSFLEKEVKEPVMTIVLPENFELLSVCGGESLSPSEISSFTSSIERLSEK